MRETEGPPGEGFPEGQGRSSPTKLNDWQPKHLHMTMMNQKKPTTGAPEDKVGERDAGR